MNLGIKRRKIEDQIVAAYEKVNFDAKKGAWVDSDTFEDFVFSFFDLRKYYEKSDDTAVGLEALRVYMDGLRALQAAAANRKLSIERRESAGRLIYELNHQMEAVMYEVERNRQEAGEPPQSGGNDSPSGGVPVLS
ncbi:MAG: hypothetical protein AAGK74_04585 [Chloroflexota bacterium]